MSLIGKWIDLIYKVATGDKRYRLIFAPIVGLMYLGFIAFFVVVSFMIDGLLGLPQFIPEPFNWIAGIPLIAFGFFVMAYSVFHFARVKGTPVPLSPPPQLVTSGPYRYARNPMLTGIFLQLFGIALVRNSLSLLLVFAPLFIAINVWELKMVEEPELEKRLGREYTDYKKSVPLFIPWRRP